MVIGPNGAEKVAGHSIKPHEVHCDYDCVVDEESDAIELAEQNATVIVAPTMNLSQILSALGFLVIATTLEVSGDAIVRLAIYNHSGLIRLGLMLAGAALLFGYGFSLNLAPVEFRQVVGLYIATLFVVWQIINFIVFRTSPNLPILVGGSLIVVGGLIVTFWRSPIAPVI